MYFEIILEPRRTCAARVDVGFIFEPNEEHVISYQKYFLKALASMFGVTQSYSRAAVIALQKEPELSIRFGDHADITSFNQAIDDIKQSRGENGPHHLDESLMIARDHMFNDNFGSSKLLIILKRDLKSR